MLSSPKQREECKVENGVPIPVAGVKGEGNQKGQLMQGSVSCSLNGGRGSAGQKV